MTKLSIIIINYNTGTHLKKCVDSIIQTTSRLSKPNSELIIIDNNSQDGSITKIKSSKKIKIILNNHNIGFARAVNQALNISVGEYKLLLNPDTLVQKNAIKQLLSFAEENTSVGVVGARLLNPDGKIQPSVIPFPTILSAIQEFWFGERNKFSKYKITSQKPAEVDSVVGAAFLITPKAYNQVGKLDPKFFMYYEDIDYCERVKKAGMKVYYLPGAKVVHYHGVSGKSLAGSSTQWKRLVPSSIAYHGTIKHYLLWFILFSGQKLHKFLN